MKYFFFSILLLSIACNNNVQENVDVDRYAHIEDDKAREVIKASIEHAGGIDTWENMKRLYYTKDFSLLNADGSVEKKFEQIHEYHFNPLVIDISSRENDDVVYTSLENGKYKRLLNGEIQDVEESSLKKAVNTSTYVIGMPFKLLDPGADISYEGTETLESGIEVHTLRVAYNPSAHKNHSTADVWKYYFDVDDHKIVGNWVQSSDHANIIENLSFERVGGILFNKERKSFRLDSLGKKEHLRAHYFYGNYQVK